MAWRIGSSYLGYTIKDYLTLGKVFIFTASGKLAPLEEKQKARIRAFCFSCGLKQPSLGKWKLCQVKIN